MPPQIVAYDKFLEWCQSEKNWLSKRALEIARNDDHSNRTGHIMRGYLAAAPFLRKNPAIARWVRSFPLDGPNTRFIETSDPKFQKAWNAFLSRNKLQHAILQKILPTTLGGQTVGGGGGAYPFKIAVRLTADMLSTSTPAASTVSAKDPRYRMVRRKEFDRDYAALNDLKKKYDYCCQICGARVHLGKGQFFCEAHHLRPLGGVHEGKDEVGNVIIVCPNHHAEFDFFLFAILDVTSGKGKLEHMYRRLLKREQAITIKHRIKKENLEYVLEQFLTRLDLHFSDDDPTR